MEKKNLALKKLLLKMASNFVQDFRENLRGKNLNQDPLNYVLAGENFSSEATLVVMGIKDGRNLRRIYDAEPSSTIMAVDNFQGLEADWRDGYQLGSLKPRKTPLAWISKRPIIHHYSDPVLQGSLKIRDDLILDKKNIDLLFVDCEIYQSTRDTLFNLVDVMTDGTYIIFDELINYPGYENHEIKALEEFLLIYNKSIYIIGMNGDIENLPEVEYSPNQRVAVRVYDRTGDELIIVDPPSTEENNIQNRVLRRSSSKQSQKKSKKQISEVKKAQKAAKKAQKEAEKAAKNGAKQIEEAVKVAAKEAERLQKEAFEALTKDEQKEQTEKEKAKMKEQKEKEKAEKKEQKEKEKAEKKAKKVREKLLKRSSSRSIKIYRTGTADEIIDEEKWRDLTEEAVNNTEANSGTTSDKVCLIVPCGRKAYLECLISYILRDLELFDKVYFYKNTNNLEDCEFLATLDGLLPKDKFEFINPELSNSEIGTAKGVWPLYAIPQMRQADTLYIKVDDDVVYVGDGAFSNLIETARQERGNYTVFSGNVINSGPLDAIHQMAGASLTGEKYAVIKESSPYKVLHNCKGATQIHASFAKAYDGLDGRSIERYTNIGNHVYNPHQRWSINVIAFFGDTFTDGDLIEILKGDEKYIAEKFGKAKREEDCKYAMAVGQALFVHYIYASKSTMNKFDKPSGGEEYGSILGFYRELAGLNESPLFARIE